MDCQSLISVIVPIYKVEQYLPQCVESLLNQTCPNLEVLLVDDGSPDGCGSLCDGYAERDSRVRVIHKPNGGLSDARNAGIEAAQGDYLAFVDGDDWVEPDAYSAMLAAAERYGAELVCAGRYDEDGKNGAQTLGLCPEREELLPAEEVVRRIFHWAQLDSAAWDKLYARRLFEGIRYPVGRVCEDVPTTYRLVLRAGNVVLLPKPIYHYRHRAGSITTSAVSEKTFHYSQHAVLVYEDIARNYPKLEPDARYLLVCSLQYNVHMLALAPKKTRARFRGVLRRSRRELFAQRKFVRSSGFFSGSQRMDYFLDVSGLLRPALGTWHFLRKTLKRL